MVVGEVDDVVYFCEYFFVGVVLVFVCVGFVYCDECVYFVYFGFDGVFYVLEVGDECLVGYVVVVGDLCCYFVGVL